MPLPHLSKKITIPLAVLFIIVISYTIFSLTTLPRSERAWIPEQNVLATSAIGTSTIEVKNIRNFSYRSATDFDQKYYDESFARGSVKNIWFVLVPFGGHQIAHAFISFEFDDGKFLAVSVEARREVGESYSPIKGLLHQYELAYIVADERDVIGLRTSIHKDNVYLYKINTTKETANNIFEDVLARANKLNQAPEFYNTLTNSCASNLVFHAKNFGNKKIPFDYRLFLPERSDELLYELDILVRDVPPAELKSKHLINDLANENLNQADFSKIIRQRFN